MPSEPTSRSSQPAGRGCGVTVNVTGLLTFIAGAAVTARGPDVAPAAMVALRLVLLQELMVTAVPLSSTVLLAWLAPKLVPVMVSELPIDPVVAETALILGVEAVEEVSETLSKVAVASAELEPLLTARPM